MSVFYDSSRPNVEAVSRLGDHSQPIRGQYPGHVITLSQSEAITHAAPALRVSAFMTGGKNAGSRWAPTVSRLVIVSHKK